MSDKELINTIIEALPQLQCKKCEYPDCASYASSIVEKNEKTNKCEPGGSKTETQLNKILSNPSKQVLQQTKKHFIAKIVKEECIGCTICIKVCPVDAIVGAKHMIHVVLEDQCNGCELCIKECPVDCMSMIESSNRQKWTWPSAEAEKSKMHYYQRISRLDYIKEEKNQSIQKALDESEMDSYIDYAIESQSKKKIKKYE